MRTPPPGGESSQPAPAPTVSALIFRRPPATFRVPCDVNDNEQRRAQSESDETSSDGASDDAARAQRNSTRPLSLSRPPPALPSPTPDVDFPAPDATPGDEPFQPTDTGLTGDFA